MSTPIQSMGFAVLTTQCLLDAGMTTLEEVVELVRRHGRVGLLRIPRLSKRAVDEVMAAVDKVMAAVGVGHQPSKQPGSDDENHERPVVLPVDLRDYLAAAAMQGLLAHHGVYEEDAHFYSLCSKKESRRRESAVPNEMAAVYAYRVADAMLEARKEKP